MESEKFTIMLIPDDESYSKSFSVSKIFIKSIVLITISLIFIIVTYLTYYVPKVAEFKNLKERYDLFVSERTEVLGLLKKLKRINQMDALVSQSLGTSINSETNSEGKDTLKSHIHENEKLISYIDNIPSVAPIQGFVTQRLGEKGVFIRKGHHGIDIVAKEGQPILASASGVVIFSDWTYNYGNLIILYHRDGYFTHYAHNKQNFIKVLDVVERGDVIALVGDTGSSTGPHLHFEIWKDFIPMDPLDYFPEYSLKDLTLRSE